MILLKWLNFKMKFKWYVLYVLIPSHILFENYNAGQSINFAVHYNWTSPEQSRPNNSTQVNEKKQI